MTRTGFFWLAALTLTAAAFSASAQDIQTPAAAAVPGPGVAPNGAAEAASLDRHDRNNDGKITKAEASRDRDLERQFGALDVNNSGELDSGEFARFEVEESAPATSGY